LLSIVSTGPSGVGFFGRRGTPVKKMRLISEDNQLRPFRWWPGLNHFELRGATPQIRPLG
jgi:hypothetical protein